MTTLTRDASGEGSVGMSPARRERLFFSGMAAAMVLLVFVGFSRTYYLKSHFGTPALSPLLHVHGALFSLWCVLFVVQTLLVATRRTRIHRRLGMAGGAVAAAMVVLGVATAINAAALGHSPPRAPPALVFLAIPLGDMVIFPILVGLGLCYRNRPDTHKRFMLLSMTSILAAATGRLPLGVMQAGPVAFFGLADLFILFLAAYDLLSRGRIHRATLLGGLLIVASQVGRVLIAGTAAWLALAGWLAGKGS